MTLHEVLLAHRDEVIQRWRAKVSGTLVPDSLPPIELINHHPLFLLEIIAALRDDGGAPSGSIPDSHTAADHGEQRLRLGFSLDAVVREYGALRDAIVDTASEAGVVLSFRELQVVFNCTILGIAHAVSEYTNQRDAEMLRQANEHFAFIAHELRNPISSACMAFHLLKEQGDLSAHARVVGALDRSLSRTSELIDQTLAVARVASGIELRRRWTTLRSLFDEAESDASAEAEAKRVELRFAIDGNARVDLDTRLIGSALGNLVRNGVKYTPSGGAVNVRGRVADGRAVIEVEDRCGGLPPGKAEQAFAPFVRLDCKESGFGLGLAIAKQAVDAHRGSIRVQNMPGVGCVFVLELPVSSESRAAGRSAAELRAG